MEPFSSNKQREPKICTEPPTICFYLPPFCRTNSTIVTIARWTNVSVSTDANGRRFHAQPTANYQYQWQFDSVTGRKCGHTIIKWTTTTDTDDDACDGRIVQHRTEYQFWRLIIIISSMQFFETFAIISQI